MLSLIISISGDGGTRGRWSVVARMKEHGVAINVFHHLLCNRVDFSDMSSSVNAKKKKREMEGMLPFSVPVMPVS